MKVKPITQSEMIVPLWQEAFGDTEEDILFFLENAVHYRCIGIYEGMFPVSMLFLVDCCLDGKKGAYIYAACTRRDMAGKGYMSALLQTCLQQEKRLCLIPARDSLVEFYAKRGFVSSKPLSSLKFEETAEIQAYLLEGFQLTHPAVLCAEKK